MRFSKGMGTFIFIGLLAGLGTSHALASSQFGSAGQDGRGGQDGRVGRSGQALVLRAPTGAASYDISGQEGSSASSGEPGYNATNCSQPTPANDLFGAAGGDGGVGGDGGSGGNGGSITAYYTDIASLALVSVRGAPGRGGTLAWGGRAGVGCRCQQSQWDVTTGGTTATYRCSDGRFGTDAQGGRNGGNGSYGSITLINQLTPVLAEVPALQVDMSQMLTGPFDLSKNHWEAHTGARQIFAPGSDIADQYTLFRGRTEINYGFEWQAARPVSDFRGWQMRIQLEGADAKLYLPNGLWVDAEKQVDGNRRTYIFHSAISTGELGHLSIASTGGIGANHMVTIGDSAGISAIVKTSVHLKYFSQEAGNYKVRYDAVVPASALIANANGVRIVMGGLGLNPDFLKDQTNAYVGLTVTQALGTNSTAYTLGTYYTIAWAPAVGGGVKAKVDADLYSGSTVVGHVARGDEFVVVALSGDWVSLKKIDDTPVKGWIQRSQLEGIEP